MASDLGRQIERFLTGGSGEPSFLDTLRTAIADAGSNRALARKVGVDEAQIRRWLRGAHPRAGSRARFDAYAREQRARRIATDDLRITTSERGSRKSGVMFRERELRRKNLRMDDQAGPAIRAAYVAGGAEAAAAELLSQVGDPWYRRVLGDMAIEDQDAAAVASEYGLTILTFAG